MKFVVKIRLFSAILVGALALTSFLAFWQSRTAQAANALSYQAETLATRYLASANSSLWALRWGVAQYLALDDPAVRSKLVEADRMHYVEFDRNIRAFEAQPISEAARAVLADVKTHYARYAAARQRVFELFEQGKMDEGAAYRRQHLSPAGAATSPAILKLIELIDREAEASARARNAGLERVADGMLLGAALVVLLAIAASIWVSASTMRQLGGEPAAAAELARAVARGNLGAPIELGAGDETSLLAQLKAMQAGLARLVAGVRQGAENVASAALEIDLGNRDLAARTESQASALEETAASMEELGSAVRHNADNARRANQLAQSASTVAVKGGEVVAQVVDTMKEINDSARRINDIINVIDGIAFQTNILALNAAVEAARAGEQGRGFAVVAGEVRSLAGRSAEAAKEIKTLITASVERVEQGSALVDQAGETMNEVVTAIRRVTDIMGEISAASSEQSAGVAQVGEAITQMDQTTQQNAALVEQMAAAASSLRGQAQELVQAVAVFRLAGLIPTRVYPPRTVRPELVEGLQGLRQAQPERGLLS